MGRPPRPRRQPDRHRPPEPRSRWGSKPPGCSGSPLRSDGRPVRSAARRVRAAGHLPPRQRTGSASRADRRCRTSSSRPDRRRRCARLERGGGDADGEVPNQPTGSPRPEPSSPAPIRRATRSPTLRPAARREEREAGRTRWRPASTPSRRSSASTRSFVATSWRRSPRGAHGFERYVRVARRSERSMSRQSSSSPPSRSS